MDDFEALTEACRRLVRTVDGLDAAAFAAPSVLPGWTRAHVVAHLTLNAEGLAGVLGGLAAGTEVAMYASQEARDTDIDSLAAAELPELRDRFLGSFQPFEQALAAVPEAAWAGDFPRLPGGPMFSRAAIPTMRLREVEIHHADLVAGYSPADWPEPFSIALLRRLVEDRAEDGDFDVEATDAGLSLSVGAGGSTIVTGTAGELGWWLAGRPAGAGLSVVDGELPELGAWR